MDDERSSCGKFDKKPFLIRFRNRKYPFFVLRAGRRKEKLDWQNDSQNADIFHKESGWCCDFIA
jgi:hypothetical protein